MKRIVAIIFVVAVASVLVPQPVGESAPAIIDVHQHAMSVGAFGPPPQPIVVAPAEFPPIDARQGVRSLADLTKGDNGLMSATTDSECVEQATGYLKKHNIIAVVSGDQSLLDRWRKAAPGRVIPALGVGALSRYTPDNLRSILKSGAFKVLGEVTIQYDGLSPSDRSLDPYWQVAEDLDIPVCIHMGMGPPGAVYWFSSRYRAGLTSPLLLEEVLIRHPRLRIWIAHAGWPMLDEMINLMFNYPQLYVDLSFIDYFLPRKEFYFYLHRLVDAGFGKRIMFGSDQMIWPRTVEFAIQAIDSAPFLTAGQKRDILYNNAARFLRLPGGTQ